ncbi:DUF222 domain-containing protein [Actinotalea ferrariae]|uniref:HNH endonuclease signature motif containing protein n=1 Tax=Actinotalea ferrariae TaxID=1386098 RepID=UPI001C8C4604|nr:HNH endonuclease signature motif containing protein [Actinotalea ferrariae]MBX9246258.1 DUF222 domain-containing protein [Actinotalea ferrariae]
MSGSLVDSSAPPAAQAWDALPAGVRLPDADVLVVVRPWVARELADDDLLDALAEVEAAGRRVDAARAALAAEVAERSRRELGTERLSARRGCRDATELVQRVTGASVRAVNQRVRLGAATRPGASLSGGPVPPRFPAVAHALDEGLLGLDAATAVVDTLAPAVRVAGTAAVQAAEAEIVAGAAAVTPTAAPQVDADGVRLQATVWRAALDPDGTAPSELDVQRRCLVLGATHHGLVRVRGMVLPEVAGALERYADAWTNPRSAALPAPASVVSADPRSTSDARVHDAHDDAGADKARARNAGADGEVADDAGATDAAATDAAADGEVAQAADPRSRAQRLHDVLANALMVATRAADAPSVAGQAPTLVVTVRQEDLAAGRGVAWADDRPVSLAAAQHVGCAGAVETVVVGRQGRVVGLRSRERCFTGQQRRAIAVRDGTCVIPGCHVPIGWCEVHHVVPHAEDPDGTHTDNGVLLCWFHHRTLDTSGWEVQMRDGVPWVRAPAWLDPDRRWAPALRSSLGKARRMPEAPGLVPAGYT